MQKRNSKSPIPASFFTRAWKGRLASRPVLRAGVLPEGASQADVLQMCMVDALVELRQMPVSLLSQ